MRELAQALSLPDFKRRIGPFGLVRHAADALEALPPSDGAKTAVLDPAELVGKIMLLALADSEAQVITLTRLEPGAEMSVGRLPGRDLTIDHRSVSKLHAVLRWSEQPYGCMLRDLGSTNGTFVNARKLDSDPVMLQDGDIVSFGDVAYGYQLAESIHRRLAAHDAPQRLSDRPSAPGAPIAAVKLRKTPPRPPGVGGGGRSGAS